MKIINNNKISNSLKKEWHKKFFLYLSTDILFTGTAYKILSIRMCRKFQSHESHLVNLCDWIFGVYEYVWCNHGFIKRATYCTLHSHQRMKRQDGLSVSPLIVSAIMNYECTRNVFHLWVKELIAQTHGVIKCYLQCYLPFNSLVRKAKMKSFL